jgi:hypothetical protein
MAVRRIRIWGPWLAALVGLALLSGFAWALSRDAPNLESRSSWLQRSLSASERRGDVIRTTQVPFGLPPHLTDVELSDGDSVDLAALVPDIARRVGGLLDGAALRINLGKPGSAYELEIQWNAAPESGLELKLYDALSRPLGRWSESNGSTGPVKLQGGVYRLVLSAESALGEDFRLLALGQTSSAPAAELRGWGPGQPELPTIRIMMSPANYALWDRLRREAYAAMSSLGIPVDLPDRRVTARINVDGGESQAKVWLAGRGLQEHANERWPSFTVQLRAGPLVRGFSRFKLYHIRTQHGLLDYVIASMLEDEGVLVPRKRLASVSLNNRSLGLYVMEEIAKTQGHFESLQRYDGQISAAGRLYVDNAGVWQRKRPLTSGEEYSEAIVSGLASRKFAKAMALVSRFHLAHAIERDDLRLYRSVLLDELEPWLRDINADAGSDRYGGLGALLTHAGWWLRPSVIGHAAWTNARPHPPMPGLPAGDHDYQGGPATLGMAAIHPGLLHFLHNPARRALFDAFLFYASDPAFQARFARRMRQTFELIRPDLRAERREKWISSQVAEYAQTPMQVVQAIPAFETLSRLLIMVEPEAQGLDANARQRIVTLYNLSPYSAALRLPDFVQNMEGESDLSSASPPLLAPSQFFLSLAPHAGFDGLGQTFADWAPNPAVARRLLALESFRFTGRERHGRFSPLRRVLVASDRLPEFLQWLGRNAAVSLGGVSPLPPQSQVVLANTGEVSDQPEPDPTAAGNLADTWGRLNRELPDPDLLVNLIEVANVKGGTRFTYLVSNLSTQPIEIDVSKLAIEELGRGKTDARIAGIWELGEVAREVEDTELRLGPTPALADWHGPRLPSPWLWPGDLTGLIRGPLSSDQPNMASVELIVGDCGLVLTDAAALAVDAKQGRKVQTLVVEPTWVSCGPGLGRTPLGRALKPLAVFSSDEFAQGTRPLRLGRTEVTSYHTLAALASGDSSPWSVNAAFDDNAWSAWKPKIEQGVDAPWLALDFGEPIGLARMDILFGPLGTSQRDSNAGEFLLQGSDESLEDGSWTNLNRLVSHALRTDEHGREWTIFAIPASRSYRYYRLLGTSPSDPEIREIRFETSASPAAGPETTPVGSLVEAGLLTASRPNRDGLTVLRPATPEVQIAEVIEIPANYVLELPPGSVIRFAPEAGLLSYGPIRALGSPEAPIRFLPADPEAGFRGIAIVDSKTESVFEEVEMAGARGGFFGAHQISGGLSVYRSSIRIARSRFHDLPANDGIHFSHTAFTIEDSVIEATASDAVDIDWSFGTIARSFFERCGADFGDCIDISGSLVELQDNRIFEAADKGVSIGEGSDVRIEDLQVTASRIGVAVKDGTRVYIEGCRLSRNEYGLLRYIKKPFYPYPELRVKDCDYADNGVARIDEPGHIWTRRYD